MGLEHRTTMPPPSMAFCTNSLQPVSISASQGWRCGCLRLVRACILRGVDTMCVWWWGVHVYTCVASGVSPRSTFPGQNPLHCLSHHHHPQPQHTDVHSTVATEQLVRLELLCLTVQTAGGSRAAHG